ncbi:MAG: hypothetical protein GOVbin2066_38 [Prokaryotic dsDNA virus sp.]|nr:MAG: hypothetical protein GOVbin2066_38 [Prokaryotic dsDNA virus sp.]
MPSMEDILLNAMKGMGGDLFGSPQRVYSKGYGGYPEAVNVKDIDTMHDFTIQKGDIWSHEMEGEAMVNKSGAWLTDKNGLKVLGSLNADIPKWLGYHGDPIPPKSTSVIRHGKNRDRVTLLDKNGNEYEMGYKAYLETLK